jgi:predicted amidophosphoribosyltransferase
MSLPPIRAMARYSGPARAAILAGKEHGRTDLPALIGNAVGSALLRLRRAALLPDQIWIVPAPSRRAAARRRGGDPVTLMARAAARRMAEYGAFAGVAPCLYTAARARDSVGLDAAGRAANLAGRVRLRRSATPPAGALTVLLDDVLTTGSTSLASIRALQDASIGVAGVLAVATAAPWRS